MFEKKSKPLPPQSLEQIERVSYVQDRLKEGANEEERMRSFAQLSYYAGKQWIAITRSTKQIIPIPKEPWQVQYTANRIMPAVRTELAKITRNKLTQGVVPASTEDADIRAARLAEKVAEWMEYDLELQEIDEEVILLALTTRIGFVKVVWNPNKGMQIGKEKGKPLYEGDIDIEVVSIFNTKWDLAADTWNRVRWRATESMRTLEYVESTYGVKLPEQSAGIAVNAYSGRINGLTSDNVLNNQTEFKNCVQVVEYEERPTAEYPRGRRIVVAGDRELHYQDDIGFGDEDNTERELSLFPLIHIPIPGRILGTNIVEQLMPVQKEYNTSRSQIVENKNLMANPKWVAVENSVDGEITNEPAQVIWYKQGFNPPVMTQPTSLGADVDKSIQHCLEEFMNISGQNEVSHGTTPTGVSSGVAIQLLQEQDDTKLAPSIAKYGRFKQRYMSYGLKMIRFKYTEERTIKLVGKNKRLESEEFRGSQLTSTDIRFQDMSLTQLSSAAKKQYLMELIQLAVLDPIRDRDLIMRALELGINDEVYDGMEVDIQQAMNENAEWAKGDFSHATRDFYNHEIHVAQHNKFRKGDEYEQMPPEAQMIIDMHVQEHLTYIMQATIPQQPAETNPDGSPTMDMDKIMGALTPEEQQQLQQNPSILDSLVP